MSEKKGAERRRHPRDRKRLTVRFGVGDFAHAGYSQDISESGLYLVATAIFSPGTVLQVQIDYPDGTRSMRGVVRWAKDLPPAFRRNLRGGMGIEFAASGAARAGARTSGASAGEAKRSGVARALPPEMSEQVLRNGDTKRRQVSTRGGSTYEVLQTAHRGGIYVRIYQLPRSDSSEEARFRQAFWKEDDAEAAVKAFLKAN